MKKTKKTFSFKILSDTEFEVRYTVNNICESKAILRDKKIVDNYKKDFTIEQKKKFFEMVNEKLNKE